MSDRACNVLMLDDSIKTFRVQSTLTGEDLFSLVASQYALHEKEYFGLAFNDPETGLELWLDLQRTVRDQVPKGKALPSLRFSVRYYVNDIRELKELSTQRLFFQHALRLLSSGKIGCDAEQAMTLAALALQAIEGDFIDASATRHHLDARKLIPDEVLVAQGSSLETCAHKVAATYETLIGMDPGSAVLSFMTIVQTLPQYGIHYYSVKDKKGVPWLLGICSHGIRQYYFSDPVEPRQAFGWNSIVNLSFSKARFVVEVDESMASTGDAGDGLRRYLFWMTPSVDYSKTLLSMAVEQHKFHLRTGKEQPGLSQKTKARSRRLKSVETEDIHASPDGSNRLATPAQRTIRLPSQVRMEHLLGKVDRLSQSVLAQAIEESPAEASDAELERLEKRRRQLHTELERKLVLLDKLEQEERDWLTTVHGRAVSVKEAQVFGVQLDEGRAVESPSLFNSPEGPESPRRPASASSTALPTPHTEERGATEGQTAAGDARRLSVSLPKLKLQSAGSYDSLMDVGEISVSDEDASNHSTGEEDIPSFAIAGQSGVGDGAESPPAHGEARSEGGDTDDFLLLLDEAAAEAATASASQADLLRFSPRSLLALESTSEFSLSLRVAELATPEPEGKPSFRPLPKRDTGTSLASLLSESELRSLAQRINSRGLLTPMKQGEAEGLPPALAAHDGEAGLLPLKLNLGPELQDGAGAEQEQASDNRSAKVSGVQYDVGDGQLPELVLVTNRGGLEPEGAAPPLDSPIRRSNTISNVTAV